MAMETADFENVLQEALTERDTTLQERELPEINIGEALPIKEGLDFALEYVDFGVSKRRHHRQQNQQPENHR